MTLKNIEVALALLLVLLAGFFLWDLSYVNGAIAATIAILVSVMLYVHSERLSA